VDGKLSADVRGEVEKTEDNVLVVRRIIVEHKLVAAEEHRATAERVLGVYAKNCPLYRTVHSAIAITSQLTFIPE